MGRLIVTTFVSLDGMMNEPQNWSLAYWNDGIAAFKDEENQRSSALLLGRVTYEGFAQAWPDRDGAYADHFNAIPKYVVSDTLDNADWNNSHILRGGALHDRLLALKDQTEGDIAVHGSGQLVRWLLQNRLVDRLHLLVYPIILGSGRRLLEGTGTIRLDLLRAQPFASGANLLVYQPLTE